MNNEELVYYILQYKYLQAQGVNDKNVDEIIDKTDKIFPDDWFINYNYTTRNKLLSTAITNNLSLDEVLMQNENDESNIIK